MDSKPTDNITDNIENLDGKEEKKPKKGGKSKKIITYISLVLAGIIIAVLLICVYNYVITGASSPEKAVASYLKASMLYDTKNMIEYASDYQKISLNDGQKTNDSILKSTLDKFYKGKKSRYEGKDITFSLTSVTEYEEGSAKFEEYMKRYGEKADTENIKKIAVVNITTLTDGQKDTKSSYVAVKQGLRWYYGFAGA